jgi:hypothetical protein
MWEIIALIVLIVISMVLSWKFGYDTGWVRGFSDRSRLANKKPKS